MNCAWRTSIASHTARFASSSNVDQPAISSIVRRHPSHQPVDASILHTLMHGDGTEPSSCLAS
ncbi:hypothetical protein CI15_07275 [Paraburkholderia monticola]|uniref:Uncharacterized protein n=1 Tax=Paraburkholderia monticola TaxID=1399968 RepID=A0A149PY31_9BURK|nr:hypothetical protein CI15_07275 [Paraburkholderia monticola]